jgi:hypothetical protein
MSKSLVTYLAARDAERTLHPHTSHTTKGHAMTATQPERLTDVPALIAELRHVQGQRRYLLGQLAKKDAETGRGDRAALREFLSGESAEEQPTARDTLPAWLRQRFTASAVQWEHLDDAEQSYWEHQAQAVRRAVARNGFKPSDAGPAA